MSRSAGDHEFREIRVTITPLGDHATVSVHTRRRRGSDVVWERRLGYLGLELGPGADERTTAALLRLAAHALEGVAQRADT